MVGWSRSELRARGIGDPLYWSGYQRADDLFAVGVHLLLTRKPVGALEALEAARNAARKVGVFRAMCDHRIGIAFGATMRMNQAWESLTSARRWFASSWDDEREVARIDLDLAHVTLALYAPDLAIAHLKSATRRFEPHWSVDVQDAYYLTEVAALHAALGERDEAVERFELAARSLWANGSAADVMRSYAAAVAALRPDAPSRAEASPTAPRLWRSSTKAGRDRFNNRFDSPVPGIEFV